jgi:pyrimidine-nucleoside phosphorylase
MMNVKPQEIIAKKRDGVALTGDEISAFIDGVTQKSWTDYQTSALLMAMFIKGLDLDEQNALTEAMLHSGEILDFSDIAKPKADKHSTGGVGDKTSLLIAPLVAACGVAVPMISGRGLGHTGGTLDKLESIPGYNVKLSTAEFRNVINEIGFAMAGQSAEIAPADKKLYALRDATSTVPYIPLIVASIMSKKLAEGLDALVLDVKTGAGAFIPEFEESKKLAEALVETGKSFGVKTEAVISDMSQPLGKYVGNALEVFECIKILRGEADEEMLPTLELSVELAARMLVLSGVSDTLQNAKSRIQNSLNSGEALEKLRQNIGLQNGDSSVCDDPESLFDKNLTHTKIRAARSGFVSEIDTCSIGEAVGAVGGGRTKADDSVDHRVGYACEAKIGDAVKEGETIGVLFCGNEDQAAAALGKLQNAYQIRDEKPQNLQLIKAIVN